MPGPTATRGAGGAALRGRRGGGGGGVPRRTNWLQRRWDAVSPGGTTGNRSRRSEEPADPSSRRPFRAARRLVCRAPQHSPAAEPGRSESSPGSTGALGSLGEPPAEPLPRPGQRQRRRCHRHEGAASPPLRRCLKAPPCTAESKCRVGFLLAGEKGASLGLLGGRGNSLGHSHFPLPFENHDNYRRRKYFSK